MSERNSTIWQRYQQGETLGQLVAAFGITRQRIWQIILSEAKLHGENPRPNRKGANHKTVQISRPIMDYAAGKKTAAQAAVDIGRSQNSVRRQAHKFGLPIIARGIHRKTAELAARHCAGEPIWKIAQEIGVNPDSLETRFYRHERRLRKVRHENQLGLAQCRHAP